MTLTKNEILCLRDESEKFRLILVVVGEHGLKLLHYLKSSAFGGLGFAETTRTFSLRKLLPAVGDPA